MYMRYYAACITKYKWTKEICENNEIWMNGLFSSYMNSINMLFENLTENQPVPITYHPKRRSSSNSFVFTLKREFYFLKQYTCNTLINIQYT